MDITNEIDELLKRYADRRGALLPALYLAQEKAGWLSQEALETVSEVLNLPKATVKGVATFYSMYKHRPMGRHLIQLCTNVACMVLGAERLVDLLEKKYGLRPGGTTEDGRFSLVIMECIGACDRAPAMLVNSDFHADLNENNILEILESYK
jgi:NADH-quinone oxidoreductase E subunit